jgi:hypothetical protein
MATRASDYRFGRSVESTTHGLGNLVLIGLISLILWAIIIAAAFLLF